MTPPKSPFKLVNGILILVAIFFILLALTGGTLWLYQLRFAHKIFPGVQLGRFDVSQLSYYEANESLQPIINQWFNNGLTFTADGKQISIEPILISPADPDVYFELLTIDLETSLQEAYQIGRRGTWLKKLGDQYQALTSGVTIPLNFSLDRTAWIEVLKENYQSLEQPAQNANFKIFDNKTVGLIPERGGLVFDYHRAVADLENQLTNLDTRPIQLQQIVEQPGITEIEARQKIYQVHNLIDRLPIKLTSGNQNWKITVSQAQSWLELSKNKEAEILLNFDEELTYEFLEAIATKVDKPAREASFQIAEGRVTSFRPGRAGQSLDLEETYNALLAMINSDENNELEIVIKVSEPKVSTGEANDLGIAELLGTGHSNFKGSPSNRRHNIKIGADALNGLLIKPGEEFSLVKALGEIDAKSGYKQELVIKGDKTIPEYGGGLCQIGTTTFRAALETGLPITERRNHSYNVSYYLENGLPGTDATIYGPHPDLRFVNDTPGHVLIMTRMEGDNLFFEFWGTKDDRQASRTRPEVWGKISPPATKYVETTDLEPGIKKCTERAHAGLKAKFNYTVTYADGRVEEQEFKSTYRPWQALCLIGVEELTEEENEEEKKEIEGNEEEIEKIIQDLSSSTNLISN